MIILFGGAGSGKSEQGRRLAEKYGWRWLSVGQLLRERAESDEALGKELLTGELVDDKLVVEMMHEEIAATEDGGGRLVLDGYPRDEWQAKWLVKHGDVEKVQAAIIIEVPNDELKERLLQRGRADDTEEVIERRLRGFDETIGQITRVLKEAGVALAGVNGSGTKDEVQARIENTLRKMKIIEEK